MPTQTITSPAECKIGQDIFQAVYPHSFDFLIQLPYSDAIDFIRMIGDYNCFEPQNVIDALARIDRIIGRFTDRGECPTNGEQGYRLSIGRNPSPLVRIERFERSIDGNHDHWLTEEAMKHICSDMQFNAHADDATYRAGDGDRSRVVSFQFWWD